MQYTPKKSFDSSNSKSPISSGGKASPFLVDNSGGRFIPNRVASNLTSVFEKAGNPEVPQRSENDDENSSFFAALLQNELFGSDITNLSEGHQRNLLRYKPSTPCFDNKENMPFEPFRLGPEMPDMSVRKVSKTPYKVLDAPQLLDDYYLNLLDWSAQDQLAIGLNSAVYLWSPTGSVNKLCELDYGQVTSVAWTQDSRYIAVGTSCGAVKVYDPKCSSMVRKFQGHSARVGAVTWNDYLMSSGSRDRNILHRDLRSPEDFVAKLMGHRQEVCGLRWSAEGDYLASGGNDNKLMVWSPESTSPIAKFSDHKAAVKALAWSPHQRGLLVSGGGTADRTIRFWDTLTSEALSVVDTNSQVCSLMFSKHSNELVSTHGYSQNQVVVWKYPTMQKVAVLLGHTSRVLYLAMSADGQNIVTGAGDETLRFWNVFARPQDLKPTPSAMLPSFAELR
jgi:cell division cycle 20-like protein 1 (cofactor of APC complex)